MPIQRTDNINPGAVPLPDQPLFNYGRVGMVNAPEGAQAPLRLGRSSELMTGNAHGFYQEQVFRGACYAMNLVTSTGVATGQIVGATAADSVQFAVFNPIGSGVLLSLIRFRQGVISGTPGAGAVMHSVYNLVPTLAASGTAVNLRVGAGNFSKAKLYASGGGATLTGSPAPTSLMFSNISYTATAQATASPSIGEDALDGLIILPPGYGWSPLQPAAGTAFLVTYNVVWEEIPL